MTSHHSSRSARSSHGGPQSTHIAQHLRRASIIESRKAKAADRNAHAEKVRLRAAMNKAAPRVTTDSDERALAAQQARERLLAQVKANCAAEVKRSKRVAEEQREKKAAEHLKMKEDMEERHAEAERRKALLQQSQKRPRTATLPTTEYAVEGKELKTYIWKPKGKHEAAKIIQQAWRDRLRRKTILDFMQLELSVEAVQKADFEEVRELLSQDSVLSSTGKLLKAFGLNDDSNDDTQERLAVRSFLSTFIILGQPKQIFNKAGEQEKDLKSQAENLLLQLNQEIDTASSFPRSPTPQLADLSEAYGSFQRAFAAWRAHDSSFMISGMLAQFVELDAIWQRVKDDKTGEVATDYKEGIQNNQTSVLISLKKLAGPEKAMRMIKDAIRGSRKSRAKKTPDSEKRHSQPRVAAIMNSPSGPSPVAAVESFASQSKISAKDDRSVAKERLQASSPLMPASRDIIHELAINKEWKIDVQKRESQRDAIIEATSRQLQEALDAGLANLWIPALAESILQKLSSMLEADKPFHTMISEALDPKLVASQISNGSFTYQNFFLFMNSILPKLCAPVRDEEVKILATNPSEDPVKQLARIYFVIDLLTLDMLNFQLMRMTPTLISESVGYESRAFSKALGDRFPERTLAWWRDAAVKTQEEASRRNHETASSPASKVTPNKIYMQGLVDLAIMTTPIQDNDVPETLELDRQRFTRIRGDVLRIVTIGSILLSAKNLLRRDTRSLWKAESQRMWDLPFSTASTAFVAIIESRYALPPITKQQLLGNITRVLSETKDGQANHPVMKVMVKKIKTHILSRLSAFSAEERIRASTTATEFLGSGGMPEFVGRIGDIAHELGRVADVDRAAHGEWYDKMAERVAKDGA